MKKFLLLAALSATTFFTSCNSNDDDSDSTKTSNELVGTWKLKESGSIENGKEVSDELDECDLKGYTTFTEDNNVTDISYENYNGECEPEESTGKWSLDGNKLTFKLNNNNDDDNRTITIESLTKEELKIIFTYSNGDKEYSILTRVN